MATPWLCRRPVSQCPKWHKKVKPRFVACMSDYKPNEVSVAYTDEVYRKNEARKAVGSADGAWEASDWKNRWRSHPLTSVLQKAYSP